MGGQFSLGFSEMPPGTGRDRLYFALKPDALAARRIYQLAANLKRELGLSGPLIPPERLHVSLYGIGEFDGVPTDMVESVRGAAARIAEMAFEVNFDRIDTFGNGHAVVLTGSNNVPEIIRFWESLCFAMEGVPFERNTKGRWHALNPHITILYDDVVVGRRDIRPLRWMVRDFVLVHSYVGQGRHDQLGRWPLR